MGLAADDVLLKHKGLQIVPMTGNRLLVRHGKGSTIRPAIPLADLETVLACVNGRATVAEIVATLESTYEPEDVRALLEAFVGDALRVKENTAGEAEQARRLFVWGDGAVLERFLTGARERGFPDIQILGAAPLAAHLAEADLLVCLPDGQLLRTCFQVARAALKQGVPTLFLTGEAGQLFLGPVALAGASACVACLRASSFGNEAATDLLADLGRLRTDFAAAEVALKSALPELLQQVSEVMAGDYEDFASGLFYGADGSSKRRHVTQDASCPLCGQLQAPQQRSAFVDRMLALALAAKHRILKAFSGSAQAVAKNDGASCSVGIVGGGTAGYMAALALRVHFPEMAITLIESSDIPAIGVGEATTPLLPQFLHADLGLDAADFCAKVQPTFKLGIQFNWSDAGTHFMYPFGTPRFLEPLHYDGSMARSSLNSLMMASRKLPLVKTSASAGLWLDAPELAYHLDNQRFAQYLGDQARSRGIRHLDCRIEQVRRDERGENIEALIDDGGRSHSFDFYLDCTGFRSLLMGDALNSGLVDFSKNLSCNRALLGKLPCETATRSYTRATAMDAGWHWDIPQRQERHLGYVYNNGFCSDAAAEAEMRKLYGDFEAGRVIHFGSGRRTHFIKGNVAALGNAYAFVEPLESTSLHMLIRQIGLLVRSFPLNKQDAGQQQMINRQVNGWWDYLHWFLAIHYKFNEGKQSDFWRHCRETVNIDSHSELVDVFRNRGPLSVNGAVVDCFSYPDPLWGPEGVDTLLLGQGVKTQLPIPTSSRQSWQRWCAESEQLVGQLASVDEVLASMDANPALASAFGKMFQKLGPAFGKNR